MSPEPSDPYRPQRVTVIADRYGHPVAVEGVAVEMVRERWWVEDRWWTSRPLDRRYFELVLTDGRNVTVFRGGGGDDDDDGHWYRQRA